MLPILRSFRLSNTVLPLLSMAAGLLISRGNFQAEFWLAALAYVLAHSLVTLWNDIADETVDGLNGTPRIFQLRKQVSAKYIRMMLWLLTASLVACLVPVPWVVRGILLTFMVLGWLYNQKPAQLSRRPLGSMVVMFLAYGLLPFALGASFGDPNGAAVLLGLGLSLNRLSLSLLKDYKDAPGDAKAHKRTFLLRYGGTLTARLSLGLAVVGMGMVLVVLASQTLSTQYLVLVVTAGWLLYERSKLFRHQDYVGLNRVFHDCLYYQLIFDTMVVLWLSI